MHFKVLCMVFIFAFKGRCRGGTADQCPAQETISKHALKGYTFKTIKVSSPFECLYHCHYEDRCQSYNYLNAEDICEMNNRTKEAKPNQFVPDQRRLYKKRRAHRVVLGSTPSLPGESCREIKANEAGEVVSGGFWLDPRSSGEAVLAYCDMNTEDFCFRHQCENGASCINGPKSYSCLCDRLWTGTYCETIIVTAKSPSKSTLAPTRGTPTMVATAQLTFTANPTNWISTPAANTQMLPTLAPTLVETVLASQSTPSTVSTTQLTATATPGIQSTGTPGFRVTVVTSDVYGAGTDALLYIALKGTNGRKSGLTEIVSEQEDFERGSPRPLWSAGGRLGNQLCYNGSSKVGTIYVPIHQLPTDFTQLPADQRARGLWVGDCLKGGFKSTDHFIVEFQDVGIIDQIAIDLETIGSFGEGWTVDEITIEDPSRERTYKFYGPRDVYPQDDPLVLQAS